MPAQKNVNRIELPVIVVITVLTTSISEPTALVIVFAPVSANNIDITPFFFYFIVISEIKALPLYPQP